MGPAADPGEEMPLPMPGNVLWLEVGDGLVDDGALRDVAMADELAQPCSCEWVVVVVESEGHLSKRSLCKPMTPPLLMNFAKRRNSQVPLS